MAVRRNPDGSITVGILREDVPLVSEEKASEPSPSETEKKPTKKKSK